ncbi:hypothetical protein Cgig2_034174 [Carnegiea gigantea]|uniref:Transposase n=1 Tax=Carnegiea gigantea TaxID=171969 RepID=A0A9Q1JU07_9CARY|nr:hypothetical protein Cgig2_034174 [Carnegiea gigantea]
MWADNLIVTPSSVYIDPNAAVQVQPMSKDAFDSDVDENVEEQVEEYLESDSEDSDFNVDEQEESDEVSLDDESDDNEVLDELDLELDTEQQIRLGHVDADGSQGHMVVSKMAKVFKQGRLWSMNRDGSVSLKEGAWFHCFFYIAANAYSSFVHLKAMDKIKQKEPAAYQWLRDNEPLEHWARFKFDTNLKSTDNTNNFVESFNNAISKLRGKPMLTMLEEIRKLEGVRFDKRFQNASCWEGKVTLFVEKKLRLVEQDARNCLSIVHAGQGEFDVVEGCTNFTIKLKEHFCDYKKWQITGLPCKHIELRKRGRPEKYNRRESASWAPVPQPEGQATRHFSGTKRCKQCKQLGHTSLNYGRLKDESGRLSEKYKKKRKISTRPVGRLRKTLCTTGTSVGISDPTSTAIEAPQA